MTVLSALDGSMPNDGFRMIAFGKANTNYNQAEFVYKHVCDGSGNNLLGIGFKNITNLYCKGDGKVGVGTGSPAFTFDVAGDVGMTGQLQIQNDSPTITLRDTNNKTGYIHMNSDLIYFLGGSNNSPYSSWTQVNSQWPMTINVANNNVSIGGGLYIAGSFGVYMTSMTYYASGPTTGAWTGRQQKPGRADHPPTSKNRVGVGAGAAAAAPSAGLHARCLARPGSKTCAHLQRMYRFSHLNGMLRAHSV